MLINVLYLMLGTFVGFLIKYELDSRNDKKRVSLRMAKVSHFNVEKHNEILQGVKELNDTLKLIQNKRGAGK